jgi:hypothetical protein
MREDRRVDGSLPLERKPTFSSINGTFLMEGEGVLFFLLKGHMVN